MRIKKTRSFYRPGDINVVCWYCKRKVKRSDVFQRYDGRWVCNADEAAELNPSTPPPKIPVSVQHVSIARPEGTDTFRGNPLVWNSIAINWEDISSDWGTITPTV